MPAATMQLQASYISAPAVVARSYSCDVDDVDAVFRSVRKCQMPTYRKDGIFALLVVKPVTPRDYAFRNQSAGGVRVSRVAQCLSVIKAEVAGILTQLPHMATRADVAQLPYMAAKADVSDAKTSIVQWIVGTIIAVAALTFTIAKIIH